MIDQATELRKLVLRAMRNNPVSAGPAPRLLALTGGKGGVGVTTIAVNLSVALAEQGARVVVVDANLHRSDVATLCGLTDYHDIADVLAAKRDVHEVLQRGPAGIQIVPGLTNQNALRSTDDLALTRLQRQLATLGRHAEIVVIDLGSGDGELVRRFCDAASEVLLVTTPDNVAVMDSYAWVKTNIRPDSKSVLRLIVNQTLSDTEADDVAERFAASCKTFLKTEIAKSSRVPRDGAVPSAAAAAVPFVIDAAQSPAAEALQQLAVSVSLPSSTMSRRAA